MNGVQPGSPKVSVLAPTCNFAYLLALTLDPIEAQTYRDDEIIVCDDCSQPPSNQL